MSTPAIAYDPASYRDRQARVFYRDGEVLRGLGPAALETWQRVRSAPFFSAMVAEGKIVATEEVAHREEGWVAVLRHARVPVVSYPFEWSFGMLRTAADLQLELVERALHDGIAVRDATPFNIQFFGHRPTFIDVTSFAPFVEGGLWAGYRQFCELFLFPLLLQAYRGADFRPWLRGRLDGIPAAEMAKLLSARDRLRPGVLTHVDLQAKLQRRYRAASSQAVDRSVRTVGGDSREMILANIARLRRLVAGLPCRVADGGWDAYETTNTYSDADREQKERFVGRWASECRPKLTMDIGCNTGTFSRIAAASSAHVLAADSDPSVIERLYARLREGGSPSNILPLVWDAVDPTPGLGWNGAERRPLTDRIAPDLVLSLALIHHLVIGRNVPMGEVVAFLARFGAPVVIEWVDRDDPMARHLLSQKDEEFADYDRAVFEAEVRRLFSVVEQADLPSGTRTLYFARPRTPGSSESGSAV